MFKNIVLRAEQSRNLLVHLVGNVHTDKEASLCILLQKTAVAVAHVKRGNGMIKLNGMPHTSTAAS